MKLVGPSGEGGGREGGGRADQPPRPGIGEPGRHQPAALQHGRARADAKRGRRGRQQGVGARRVIEAQHHHGESEHRPGGGDGGDPEAQGAAPDQEHDGRPQEVELLLHAEGPQVGQLVRRPPGLGLGEQHARLERQEPRQRALEVLCPPVPGQPDQQVVGRRDPERAAGVEVDQDRLQRRLLALHGLARAQQDVGDQIARDEQEQPHAEPAHGTGARGQPEMVEQHPDDRQDAQGVDLAAARDRGGRRRQATGKRYG